MSHEEIALELNISSGACRTRHRAKKNFENIDMKQMDDTDLQTFQALAPLVDTKSALEKTRQQNKQKPQWVTWVASIAAMGSWDG